MYSVKVNNEEETLIVAYHLGKKLFPGCLITLDGDLGAGKTTFTKGIAKGLEIKQIVNSPTFTIIKEYEGKLPLYHMDVYRINDDEDLGFDEYFYGNGVTVIEWANNIRSLLPHERLSLNIVILSDSARHLKFTPFGKKYGQICEDLKHEKIID